MELTPYLEGLRRDLAAAAAPGGPDIQRAADMLAGSLDASARLFLLEALSDAAAEITSRLAQVREAAGNISVEVRLRGRDAQLVVSGPTPAPEATAPAPAAEGGDTGDLARITLRLPEQLKETVERLAAAESISTNAWLVRAIAQIVRGGPPSGPVPPGRGRLGRRVTGYAEA
jgi:predicted transcriptional regulator